MTHFYLPKPLHCFLVPIFFILHVLTSYFGLLKGAPVLKYTFYYLLLSAILLLLSRILFRDMDRRATWTTMLLCVFFFFGALHDALNPQKIPYKVLLPLLLILIIAATVLLKRIKASPAKFNLYLNVLFIVLVIMELFSYGYKLITHADDKNIYSLLHPAPDEQLLKPGTEAPDIYFIVFDEFASSNALKEYLHFDNSKLDSALTKNNFYLVSEANSNYNSTPFSLASTLSMDYFNDSLEMVKTTGKVRLRAFHSIEKSSVPAMLQKIGYRIVNLGLTNLATKPVTTEEFFQSDKEKPFYLETLWGRVNRDIMWNFRNYFPDALKTKNVNTKNFLKANTKNYRALTNELMKQDSIPRFVYAHFMLPHEPFLYTKMGALRDASKDDHSTDDSLYLDQLSYTNILIDSLANLISANSRRPRAVVIEGDHGYRDRFLTSSTIRQKEFANLLALYFSDGDYRTLYNSMSSVNSFRIIFNKYFGTTLPLLKDSTVLMD